MIEELGIVYTEPKIPVVTPVRYCNECRYQLQGSNDEPCKTCLNNTKGEKWEPK